MYNLSKKIFKNKSLILAIGIGLLSSSYSPLYAQEVQKKDQEAKKTSGSGLMETIVVTANRRNEKLNNVGISAVAFSGNTISRLGFTNATEITKIAASVSLNYINPSAATIGIRGVSQNDFADHLEPPVAMYQDDAYVGTSGANAVPIFDIQRVEVLRGPQGTLFGRNATGGLMHFVSTSPSETTNGYIQASYGSFNTMNFEGAIGGKIANGIKGRIAFSKNKSDGPYKNIVTGKSDAGDTNNYGIRGQLQFDLGENTDLRILGKYYNDDQHGPMYAYYAATPSANGMGRLVGANEIATYPNIILGGTITSSCAGCNVLGYKDADGNPWTAASNHPGFYKREITGGQVKFSHKSDDVTFTSLTDYLKVEKNSQWSVDMSPQNLFVYGTGQDYEQFSQELRLNGDAGKFKWVAGVYFLEMRGDYKQPLDLDISVYVGAPLCVGSNCPVGGNVPVHFEAQYGLDVNSQAIFAQGEYAISEKIALTLGARFTHDQKDFDFAWSSLVPFNTQVAYKDNEKFDNVASKAQIDYRPSNGQLFYAAITRGHKGGNWAAPAFPPIILSSLPHKQEVLTSYEIGAKNRLLNGKISINSSIYYYDYKDYQAFSLLGATQAIYNKDAIVYGGEIEIKASPFDGLELSLNNSLQHSEVKNVGLPDGSFASRVLPNAPNYQANALVRYSWPFMTGEMSVQASGKYMGNHYLTVLNEPANYQKAYATFDLRAAWENSQNNFEISLYGQNISDEVYRLYALDVSPLSLGLSMLGSRKSFGARIKYKF